MHGHTIVKKYRLFRYTALTDLFLGRFAQLRKATISFVMYVCPNVRLSVRIEQLGSYWTDFHEI